METDPLQQLRDVHLPFEPSWWPPAIGWWMAALVVLVLLYLLGKRLKGHLRAHAPKKQAQRLLANAYTAYQRNEIDAAQYAHQVNEILKRLLVKAHGDSTIAPLSGSLWLRELDALAGSDDFTQGPGSALGDPRFAPQPTFDINHLNTTVRNLIKRLKPPAAIRWLP